MSGFHQGADNQDGLQKPRADNPAGQIGFGLGNPRFGAQFRFLDVPLEFDAQGFNIPPQAVFVFVHFPFGRDLLFDHFGQCPRLGFGLLIRETARLEFGREFQGIENDSGWWV